MHRLEKHNIEIPVLFIAASKDDSLPPYLSVGMEKYIPNLTRAEVNTGHFAMQEDPVQVNKIIKEWMKSNVLGMYGKTSL